MANAGMTDIRLLAQIINRQIPLNDIQPTQWRGLITLARQHKVFPLLHEAIHASSDSVPKPVLRRLSMRGLQAKARATRLENAILEINTILDEAGIPALWLKGVALGYTVYPAFWLRPMIDIDVIVPYEQRRHARTALQTAGYTYKDTRGGHVLADDVLENSSHHYVFPGGENKGVTIELHFRFLNTIMLPAEMVAWFWQHTEIITSPQNTRLRVMAPEAILVHMAAHNILQHQQFDITSESAVHITLRNMYDVSQLMTQYTFDWPEIITQSINLKWEFALAHTLIQADTYFPFPQASGAYDAIATLRQRTSLPPPAQLDRSRTIRRTVLMWRILRQLSWKHKAVYLAQIFFPTREAMRLAHPDRPLWWAYLARSFKIVGGVSRALYRALTQAVEKVARR